MVVHVVAAIVGVALAQGGWTAPPNGESPEQVEARVADLVWSPDGTLLALQVDQDGRRSGLAVLDPWTGDYRRLAVADGLRDIAWIPDGTLLTYSRACIGADGSIRSRCVEVIDAAKGSVVVVVPDASRPVFSPTGGRMAVIRLDLTSNAMFPAVTDLATGACSVLSRTPFVMRTGPLWSPDGSRVSAVGTPAGEERPSLWVWRLGSLQPRQLVAEVDQWGMAWSREGRRLVFSAPDREAPAQCPARRAFFTVDVMSGEINKLVEYSIPATPAVADWSEDLRSVLLRYRHDTGETVLMIDVATSAYRAVAEGTKNLKAALFPRDPGLIALADGNEVWVVDQDGHERARVRVELPE